MPFILILLKIYLYFLSSNLKIWTFDEFENLINNNLLMKNAFHSPPTLLPLLLVPESTNFQNNFPQAFSLFLKNQSQLHNLGVGTSNGSTNSPSSLEIGSSSHNPCLHSLQHHCSSSVSPTTQSSLPSLVSQSEPQNLPFEPQNLTNLIIHFSQLLLHL